MERKILTVDHGNLGTVARALASPVRRRILELLQDQSLNVNALADALKIPQSTCVANVKTLENAGLIETKLAPGRNGSQKICSSACEEVLLQVFPSRPYDSDTQWDTDMPVGLFTDYEVTSPCGLVSESGSIGFLDNPSSFLDPHRANAGLIWFEQGHLQYRYPRNTPPSRRIRSVAVIAEVCSEFPGYRIDWKSDITVWINGVEVGTWTAPGDMGGEKGRLTPGWWSIGNTQYGFLKSWKVTDAGSFVDNSPAGPASLKDLRLKESDAFLVRIGVKGDAEHRGGMNIFGRAFGNHKQDVILRIELED